jgi:primosomal protein N' (replication factor Y)
VTIQTRHVTHASLQSLVANDYHSIADLLLQERRETSMPPFCHLALFRAESTDQRLSLSLLEQTRSLCTQACQSLKLGDVEIHHPLPAPMERRAGKFRTQMLVKASSRGAMQTLLARVCPQVETLKSARKVRWSIDVDPVDLT